MWLLSWHTELLKQ